MSIQYRLDGVLLTNRVSIPEDAEGFVSAAERGAIGRGGIVIEDPDGTLDFSAWRNFTVDDTDATPTRVWTGRIIDRDIGRGNQPTAGVAHTYNCRLEDQNGLLHMVLNRLIDNDAKRPAETDVERVTWLLTSRALTGIVFDEGLVSALNPGAFLASDCRRRFADDVMAEMAPSAVKNFFVYRDETSGNPALFYDKDEATVWPATIAISNDRADEDSNTVFFPDEDAKVGRGDPADGPYTGVDMNWNGGNIFAESASTITAYGMRREFVYDNPRVGLLATAQAQILAWLNVHAGETDFISVSLLLPATHVNTVYAGQEIDVKFVHIPGYEDFVTTRVRRRNARPVVSGKWQLDLELWVPSVPADDATADGECTPEASVAQLQGENRNGTGPNTYDFIWNNTGDNPDAGHAPLPLTGLLAYHLPAGTGATGIEALGSGDLTVTLLADVALVASGTYTAQWQVLKNGLPVLSEGHVTTGGLRFESWTTSPLVGVVSVVPGDILTVQYIDSNPAGGIATFPAGVDATDFTAEGDLCDEDPADEPLPQVGDPVGPETPGGDVDGVNTDFTTVGSWIGGTLRFLHDGIDQTAHILLSAPTAGEFTLDYAPSVGSTLRVTYASG